MPNPDRRQARRWSLEDYYRFTADMGEVAEREDAMQREIDAYLRPLHAAGFDSPASIEEEEL